MKIDPIGVRGTTVAAIIATMTVARSRYLLGLLLCRGFCVLTINTAKLTNTTDSIN